MLRVKRGAAMSTKDGEDIEPIRVSWQDDALVVKLAAKYGVAPETLRAALIAVGPDLARAKQLLGIR
jgi:hypothetical protein